MPALTVPQLHEVFARLLQPDAPSTPFAKTAGKAGSAQKNALAAEARAVNGSSRTANWSGSKQNLTSASPCVGGKCHERIDRRQSSIHANVLQEFFHLWPRQIEGLPQFRLPVLFGNRLDFGETSERLFFLLFGKPQA